jgi:dUTP pyrophosphatase
MTHDPHTLPVEIRILDPRIHDWGLPRHHSAMAAAIDLFACVDAPLSIDPDSPARLIPAGIAIHIGVPGYAALIVPRSGLGHRDGLVMGNLVGVLDADYMGPVMISAWNRNPPGTAPIVIKPGDRIAQMLFVPVARPAFTVVDMFSAQSARGEAGFGSTG